MNRAGVSTSEKFELYEEVKFEPYVLCQPLPIDNTFSASEIVSGDIICCQKESKIKYPSLELFLQMKAGEMKLRSLEKEIAMLKSEPDIVVGKVDDIALLKRERDTAVGKVNELTDRLIRNPATLRSFTLENFYCPISQEIMINPYMASDGFTYEEKDVRKWFDDEQSKTPDGETISPYTRLPLPNIDLIPNHNLRSVIYEFSRLRNLPQD